MRMKSHLNIFLNNFIVWFFGKDLSCSVFYLNWLGPKLKGSVVQTQCIPLPTICSSGAVLASCRPSQTGGKLREAFCASETCNESSPVSQFSIVNILSTTHGWCEA
ncbi:microtubule-associated protein 1B-like [Platysternon megacephalum]|uniref:Microtubule-associated protein 1B-like n=1 Tax=Platysternon megacephalum TaxID=55544 RepID=A0A4D9EAX8_9SAUR|nr:microtubule-associated protein 1B-like [Platysternon megacephalum]